MKNLFLFAFCSFSFFKNLNAQVPAAMPPDAKEFYDKSFPLLRPALKTLVLQSAKAMKNRKANSDSLVKTLKTRPELKGMSNNDIEGIIVLIMVQSSKDADADLKSMVMGISRQNEDSKVKAQSTSPKNNTNEQQEIQNLQLQMIMDRKSKMAEEVSYVMKRISGSQENIINNLK